uniref:Otopetrin 2 n=1 Tax=Leptobrachium leishanense TaxID=445787 RepID=A0A8C5R6H2_9ANUR
MGDDQAENHNGTIPHQEEQDAKLEGLKELSSISTEHHEEWKNGGRLMSLLLGINIILLGCALVSGGAFHEVAVVEREVLSYLTVLMGLTGCWMVIYLVWTARHKNSVMLKDSHAGPVWLRAGAVLFGVCTLVLVVLKIGKSVTLIHCESPLKIVHPVIQGVFVVIQTYFLWVASQDCAQIHLNRTRFGLMLTLSTNLTVWIAAVTDESLHQSVHEEDPHSGPKAAVGDCGCETEICSSFETGYYYLYPFNIEYSLFASAMSYVMWKNVGRIMSHNSHDTHHAFKAQNHIVGLVFGIAVLVSGLAVFIVYEIEVNSEETRSQALTMFYIFNIVALGLMSVSPLAASITYRLSKRDMDSHKNPTRTLDVALLIGAALGQFFIAYYSIVAVIAVSPGHLHDTLNLIYSILMIVQHLLQNVFIIEGLHRKPLHEEHEEHHHNYPHDHDKDFNEVYINPIATVSGEVSTHEHLNELDVKPPHGSVTHSTVQHVRADHKTRLVKEISLFLLLSNIIFWIMPAFGARPQFENGLELKFYGYPMWIAIVNIGLPFGIFYRMHAVASLVEVYIIS